MVKLAVLTSHPIQYQAPLFREIAAQPDIQLKVFFLSDFSIKNYEDDGFGRTIKWDIPLLDGYDYEFLPVYGPKNKITFFWPFNCGFVERLKGENFQALWVHGYVNNNCIRAIVTANSIGLKVLFRGESNLISGSKNPLKIFIKKIFLQWLFKKCYAFLSIGTLNKAYYKHYKVPESKIFEMPYTVDNSYFQSLSEKFRNQRESFRSSLSLQPNRPIILFASKLLRRKHPIDLLDAYIKLGKNISEVTRPYLLFVGEGEERKRLMHRAKQTGWDTIKFLGFQNQSQLPAFFDLCDVFVLPSTNEPWGLIVNEVMNAGKPVIVSDQVGCATDLIKYGENGIIFPANNVSSLYTALEKILTNHKLAKLMGENSLKIIKQWSFEEDLIGLRHALQTVLKK